VKDILLDDATRHGLDEMTDEIVAYAWRPNADGSITIQAVVNLYGPDGTQWGHGDVVIRLPASDAKTKAWAKSARKEPS
jgi:hypothetical protein